MIGVKELTSLQEGAIVVISGRGQVLDLDALADALDPRCRLSGRVQALSPPKSDFLTARGRHDRRSGIAASQIFIKHALRRRACHRIWSARWLVNRQGDAMEMHQVRYFLAVANELNFTKAAEKCNVAQPSLTRAIKLLEAEFGGPLFHRERTNTHLSELGRMVRPHLQHILEDSYQAKRLAGDFSKLRSSKLKVGVMCTIAPNQLVDLFSSLHSRYPGLELELTDASARQLDARLLEGDLEVAIYCLPGETPHERLHVMPLFREQMMIVVHPGHPLAMHNTIRLPDLEGQPYLNRVNCEFYGCSLFDGCPAWEMVYRSERDDWILAMIASGLGFGFMPENCVSHPGVVARPIVEPEYWREVNLVTVRGRPHSSALGALVREAMRVKWHGQPAISLSRSKTQSAAENDTEKSY